MMRKIFVVYKVTYLKNKKVKYGVIYYYSYYIINQLHNSSIERELFKKICKKPSSKLFKIEWLYQNIEEQECYRFLELAHNITKEKISKVLQQ